MEIILSERCESFTGSIGQGFGYYIRRSRTGRFFGQRSKGFVPPDGHWRFILACAQMAKNRLYITDIRVSAEELNLALYEDAHFMAAQNVKANANAKAIYSAADIINLKITFAL